MLILREEQNNPSHEVLITPWPSLATLLTHTQRGNGNTKWKWHKNVKHNKNGNKLEIWIDKKSAYNFNEGCSLSFLEDWNLRSREKVEKMNEEEEER
jgi:hypothetical protein